MLLQLKSLTLQILVCALALGACKARTAASAPDPVAPPDSNSSAQSRLRVMSYNVLKYGDGCQDNAAALHAKLTTIIRNAAPDILGLVKVAAPKGLGDDHKADAPSTFPQDILNSALGVAFPARYAVCPATNAAGGNDINLLFYDASKLGYAGMQTLVSNETDFNLYKLYTKKSVAAGKDTTFLYILLNHTESGDDPADRNVQMKAVMTGLHAKFGTLPNVIDMGDFNLRNTSEEGYQALVFGADAGFRLSDPAFAIDKVVTYPADWESDPAPYAKYLTTSTRKNDGEPNNCGTGGGAKFWYDHMLLSPSIVAGSKGISYVKGSYHTFANDGGRVGRSVTSDKHPNALVTPDVADALYQFSNKYPVMLELGY